MGFAKSMFNTVALLQALATKVSQKQMAIVYSQVSKYLILAIENGVRIGFTDLTCLVNPDRH